MRTFTLWHRLPLQRFWFLETVARMPYFAYISMLHLYESLGWFRAGAELRKVRQRGKRLAFDCAVCASKCRLCGGSAPR